MLSATCKKGFAATRSGPTTERKFNAYLAKFLPTAVANLQPHNTGDSLYFDPIAPHSYRRAGGRACEAIVVPAPKG